jgi:hypothetical protein
LSLSNASVYAMLSFRWTMGAMIARVSQSQERKSSDRVTWDRCYDFWKYLCQKFGVFGQNTATFLQICIITLVFKKNAIFLSKIGKNRDQNIDLRLGKFLPFGNFFY